MMQDKGVTDEVEMGVREEGVALLIKEIMAVD